MGVNVLLLHCSLALLAGAANMEIKNNCKFKIAPGIQGNPLVEGGGFSLDAGKSKSFVVPDGWEAGRIWARTGCDDQFNCETGFCGAGEKCNGRGGVPPVSLAEFTLHGAGNQDFYDVSLVDGYNIQVKIEPKQGTFTSNNGEYDCKPSGECKTNLLDDCPDELKEKKGDKVVGCKSACLAFNTDEYCCRGSHGTPETCKSSDWPRDYPKIFKDACPTAYSYAYDDHKSTFTCRGSNGAQSPEYLITFC